MTTKPEPIVADVIILDGSKRKSGVWYRRRVDFVLPDIEGVTTIYIPERLFEFLHCLAAEIGIIGGWVHRSRLPGVEHENKWHLIYRLRKETNFKIENDASGHYRLVANSVVLHK